MVLNLLESLFFSPGRGSLSLQLDVFIPEQSWGHFSLCFCPHSATDGCPSPGLSEARNDSWSFPATKKLLGTGKNPSGVEVKLWDNSAELLPPRQGLYPLNLYPRSCRCSASGMFLFLGQSSLSVLDWHCLIALRVRRVFPFISSKWILF